MRLHYYLLLLVLALSACKTPPPVADYDTSRDFLSYRTWSWKTPAVRFQSKKANEISDITSDRIKKSVTEQLEQSGLQESKQGTKGDLEVQTFLTISTNRQYLSTNYGGTNYYPYYSRRRYRNRITPIYNEPSYSRTQTIDYMIATLQIDIYDGNDAKLVWRSHSSENLSKNQKLSPQERNDKIRSNVAKILNQFPP